MKTLMIAAAAMALAGTAAAHPTKPARAPAASAAHAADLTAIGTTIDDVYAVISGPPGQARDWARMRTLFTADARMAAIGRKGVRVLTLDDYIATSGPFLVEKGFTERELKRRVEVYGQLAHAWSSYDGIVADKSVHMRGINSIQLVKGEDGRWRVQSLIWQTEHPGAKLPKDMEK